jgi:hypothetical protein
VLICQINRLEEGRGFETAVRDRVYKNAVMGRKIFNVANFT